MNIVPPESKPRIWEPQDIDLLNRIARVAGLLYLVTVVTGIFGLMYVPSRIGVAGDLSASLAHISASQPLYRLGIAAILVCYTIFLVVPLLLYRLLGPVDRNAAALMVVFAAVNVPIALLSVARKLDILSLLARAGHGLSVPSDEIHAQVIGALDAYGHDMLVSQIFAGLWLIPFGYLVFKSGFLPKILGALLVAGGFGYLVAVFGQVLVPGYDDLPISNFDTVPAGLGEIGIALWMLVVGVRRQGPKAQR